MEVEDASGGLLYISKSNYDDGKYNLFYCNCVKDEMHFYDTYIATPRHIGKTSDGKDLIMLVVKYEKYDKRLNNVHAINEHTHVQVYFIAPSEM